MEEIKTFPLSTDDIMKALEGKDVHFNVDYAKSSLKTESFVIYIANMGFSCSLVNYLDINTNDKKELLKSYAKHKHPVSCEELKFAFASVLLYSRGAGLFTDFLNEEEAKEFISENAEIVQNYSDFVDSMLITLPMLSKEFKESVVEGDYEEVKDPDVVGINALAIIQIPNFVELFITLNKEKEIKFKYFSHQIENSLYKDKTFFDIIIGMRGDSFLMSLFNMLSSTDKEETEYFSKLKEENHDSLNR